MITNFFLPLILLSLGACVTASVASQPQIGRNILDQVQSIPFNSSPAEVTRILGEPSQQASDAKMEETVFRYFEKGPKDLYSRSHFVFHGASPLLVTKYIQVYEFDPESQLKFWKEKYPNQNLKTVSKNRCSKGTIKKYNFVDIDPNMRLELENGSVTRIYWHSQPDDISSNCK